MTITVFGLGFVGLTTSLGFAEYGHTVYGIEMNSERLNTIQSGQLPFLEPGLDEALKRHLGKRFHPIAVPQTTKRPVPQTTKRPVPQLAKALRQSDCIYYCVGTPYGTDGQADLSYLFGAIDQTLGARASRPHGPGGEERLTSPQGEVGRGFQVLVVKSTIPPSTTSRKIIPYLEAKGINVGKDLGVANNPEFLREGHCWDDFINADRIVLGVSDERSADILRQLYATVSAPVHCVSLNTGEFIKYLSNTLLATLISYSNEMSLVADTIGGIDVATAFRILHEDKRWGGATMSSYVYPGCGYGGYCLPKDTNALYAVANSAGFDAQILKNVIKTNDDMPAHIAQKVAQCVGTDKQRVIAILGLSFKPGSDDVRDSPAAKIIRQLLLLGYTHILAFDPVANEEFKRYYGDLPIHYVDSYETIVNNADVFAITTAWPLFASIRQQTEKPVVDCRYMLTAL